MADEADFIHHTQAALRTVIAVLCDEGSQLALLGDRATDPNATNLASIGQDVETLARAIEVLNRWASLF